MSAPQFLAYIGSAGTPQPSNEAIPEGFGSLGEVGSTRVFAKASSAISPEQERDGLGIAISAVPPNRQFNQTNHHTIWDPKDALGLDVRIETRGNDIEVVRGRSGMMPCLVTKIASTTVIASDISTLLEAGMNKPSLNEQVVADALVFPGIMGRDTALMNVYELFPGERANIKGGRTEICADWTPLCNLGTAIANYGEAVRTVYQAVELAFDVLNTRISDAIVTVSGGLDSSIVGAMAARHFRNTRFVTFYTRDPLGDEREYARALASHCGVELIELDVSEDSNTLRPSAGFHLPRPSARTSGKAMSAALLSLAREHGADAILNGFGGDNVFCYMQSSTPLIDRLHSDSGFTGLAETARDLMELANCSLPDLLKHSVRSFARHRRSGNRYNWTRETQFLSDDLAARMEPAYPHPWLNQARSSNLGHLNRSALITRTHPFLERFDRRLGVPYISPLLTGVVLDACLRVSSWLWCRGGINRAVARDAFSSILPERVLTRRTKGSPVAAYAKTFSDNRDDLVELLGSGFLARTGMLDKDSVISFLRQPDAEFDGAFLRVLDLADIEGWCREFA